MSAPVRTHTFATPVEFGSEKVKALEFRAPKGRDLNDLPVGDLTTGALIRVGARLTGQVPTFFDELEGDDYLAVVNIVTELLGGGPATGGSS